MSMTDNAQLVRRDPLRRWIANNLHVVAFLGAYFFTVVAGNIIFATSWGRTSLAISNLPDRFLSFPNTFTFGYWALLFCPFVLMPPIVWLTRRISRPAVQHVARWLPEFSRTEFLVISAALFALVAYRFWAADAMALFTGGTDFTSSVEARFMIRERVGPIGLIPLQAILPLFAIYALVRWIQSVEMFWGLAATSSMLGLSVLFILLNMKWPVLLFYISLVLTIFIYSKSHAYIKTALGGAFVFAAFILISTLVFRATLPPEPSPAAMSDSAVHDPLAGAAGKPSAGTSASERTGGAAGEGKADDSGTKAAPAGAEKEGESGSAFARMSDQLVTATKAAPFYLPNLLVISLNRMAVPYPYYYQVFTEEGAVCGGILAQATREPICRPSHVIYSRIFVDDVFDGIGTPPQSVHTSGYALGGWPVALFALTAASVILGLFAAVPLDGGPALGTVTIVGAQTAYHLSQIPGEGIIFYEHGLMWPGLLLLLYLGWRRVVSSAPAVGRQERAAT